MNSSSIAGSPLSHGQSCRPAAKLQFFGGRRQPDARQPGGKGLCSSRSITRAESRAISPLQTLQPFRRRWLSRRRRQLLGGLLQRSWRGARTREFGLTLLKRMEAVAKMFP
ncbi:hypothetical protein PC123_g6491 [Phytophthora cactorum]|nr:hypothetical protein PC120_g2261 [Phytophthora cactorum]KAG4058549.1 hypothetical protein PC123_g6491 [Phytophthora cactorum]